MIHKPIVTTACRGLRNKNEKTGKEKLTYRSEHTGIRSGKSKYEEFLNIPVKDVQ
jgi:hypothetical protein